MMNTTSSRFPIRVKSFCSNPFCKWFCSRFWIPKHLLTGYFGAPWVMFHSFLLVSNAVVHFSLAVEGSLKCQSVPHSSLTCCHQRWRTLQIRIAFKGSQSDACFGTVRLEIFLEVFGPPNWRWQASPFIFRRALDKY